MHIGQQSLSSAYYLSNRSSMSMITHALLETRKIASAVWNYRWIRQLERFPFIREVHIQPLYIMQ
jgi:hypothetical protein